MRFSPNIDLGSVWPSYGIKIFNPFQVPLLNTIILLSSGISVTWAYHSLIIKNYSQTKNGLLITIILGIYFIMLQSFECFEAKFIFADRVYGSTFLYYHGISLLTHNYWFYFLYSYA